MRRLVGWWVALCVVLGSGYASASGPDRLWIDAKARRVRQQRSAITAVAKRAMPAVVSITTRPPEGEEPAADSQKGLGSGFVIHPDGYIVTSSHVIEGAEEIRVSLLSRRGYPEEHVAAVVGNDPHTDIALLKIEPERKLPVLKLATARNVEVADWVVVIGNPFGLAHSVTVGVISYKGRTDVVPSGRSGYFEFLQTDAPINPGSSGGPVLDLKGEVVAIANAVNVSGQGIGFAIPIDIAKAVLPRLKEEGALRRGWMGIAVQDLTPEIAEAFGERTFSGVIVSEVTAGAPGSAAGLQVGDVIVQVNKRRVERAHALRWAVAIAGAGQTVGLEVRRDGKPMHFEVELGDPPGEGAVSVPEGGEGERNPQLGASVIDVDLDASMEAGLSRPLGALVRKVESGSPMAEAGLLEGDVVLKVNQSVIHSSQEFQEVVGAVRAGEVVRLFVRRGSVTVPLSLRRP